MEPAVLSEPATEVFRRPMGSAAWLLRGQRVVGGLLDWAYLWALVWCWMEMWKLLRVPAGGAWDWRKELLHSLCWRATTLVPEDLVGWDRQAMFLAVVCWAASHRFLPSGILGGGGLLRSDGSAAPWMIGFLRQCARLANYKILWLWGIVIFRQEHLGYWMQTRGILLFSVVAFGNAACFVLRGAMLHDALLGIAQYGRLIDSDFPSRVSRRIFLLLVLPAAILVVGIGAASLKYSILVSPAEAPRRMLQEQGRVPKVHRAKNPW